MCELTRVMSYQGIEPTSEATFRILCSALKWAKGIDENWYKNCLDLNYHIYR